MTQLLLTVAGLVIAGLLSPGPNFVLITGRALSSGTRPAVAAALGVTAGSFTHALFGIAGFGALLRSSSAVLFFLALFTTVVPANTGILEGAAVIATVVVLALVGYVLIAVVFSRQVFQRGYRRIGYIFDAVFGVLMIGLGIRVALSEQ